MVGQEEKKSIIEIFTFLNEKPIVFDIGSNKGNWSDVILEEYKDNCELHLFEPNSKLLSFTEIKYEYQKNIIYNEVGVFSKSNTNVEFYYFENENNELSSLVENKGFWDGLPMKKKYIDVVSLDDYCKEKNITYVDMIKIDCEGADVDVLEGCNDLLSNNSVGIIQIEYCIHYKRFNKKFEEVIKLCNSYGYSVYYYKDGNYLQVNLSEFEEDYRFENFFITKFNIHNYSGADGGWLHSFKESVKGLPKFKFMLEVGSFEGFTAKYMCENMLKKGARIIVVDPLEDFYTEETKGVYPDFKDLYQRFLRNTKGLPIELRRGDSRIELPLMHEFRFDFAYIDGNHDICYTDAVNTFPIIREEGFILFDDAFGWSDTATAGIERFLYEYEGYYEIIKKDYQLLIKKIKNYHGNIQPGNEDI